MMPTENIIDDRSNHLAHVSPDSPRARTLVFTTHHHRHSFPPPVHVLRLKEGKSDARTESRAINRVTAYGGPGRNDVSSSAFHVSGHRPDAVTWFDVGVARLALLIECLGPDRLAAVEEFLSPAPSDAHQSYSAPVNTALLRAVGLIPMNYGELPPITIVLDLAQAFLNAAEKQPEDQTTAHIISFPSLRRLHAI